MNCLPSYSRDKMRFSASADSITTVHKTNLKNSDHLFSSFQVAHVLLHDSITVHLHVVVSVDRGCMWPTSVCFSAALTNSQGCARVYMMTAL